jgi:hypothetical protein
MFLLLICVIIRLYYKLCETHFLLGALQMVWGV